jgi:hypothetical protein
LVSYYHHVKGPLKVNPNHYDYENAQKGFDYLINVIISRDSPWPSRRFLYPQLFDQSGNCIVNWINRVEALDSDLKQLHKKFGCAYQRVERKRVSETRNLSYEDHFTPNLLDKLVKLYSREMTLFGYERFQTISPFYESNPINSTRIRYDYLSDALYLDGNLLPAGSCRGKDNGE